MTRNSISLLLLPGAILALAWCMPSQTGVAVAEEVTPLPNAHAHNDYEHPSPLHDALAEGFTSVEADIHLVDGALLVGHDPGDVRPDRTLESLYLDPLRERVRAHRGQVYEQPAEFTLLIDIKTDGEETYRALAPVLAVYDDLLTQWRDGERKQGAVTVVISGNRAVELIAAMTPRFAGVDGRLPDLDREGSAELMPLVSDRWGAHFSWRGVGEMPDAERTELQELVTRAHERGQRMRFWATADTPEMWAALHGAGVDLINTDDLPGLAGFLRNRPRVDSR